MAYKEKWKKFFARWLKKLKPYRMFAQVFGGNYGGFVEMWEFENMAECEKFDRVMKSEYTKKLYPEYAALLVPGSYSISMWNTVM